MSMLCQFLYTRFCQAGFLFLVLVSMAAQAQDKPVVMESAVAAADAKNEDSSGQDEGKETPITLQSIVVTGELIQRDARQTTSSVAVKTGTQLEHGSVRNVYDSLRSTPNVSLNDSEIGYGSMTIRGISSYGGLSSGGAYIYSSATSIVLDGVALPRAAQAYAALSAFDLERVEIFRGPQSTSQGRNAMAGVVIIKSLEPNLSPLSGLASLEWRGRLAQGNQHAYQGALAADITPVADVLGLRLGLDHRLLRGDIRNITLNRNDWARDDSTASKFRIAWRPGGVGGDYKLLFTARDIDRVRGSHYVEQANERDRLATANAPSNSHARAQLYAIEQKLDLSQHWTLKAVTSYISAHTRVHIDLDYSADDSGRMVLDQPARYFAQELRGHYEGERVKGTVGMYYAYSRDDDVGDSTININALLAAAGACSPALLCSVPLGNLLTHFAIPTRTTDLAVFGEFDWQVLDRLTLTAGLRWDHEHSERDYISRNSGDALTSQLTLGLLRTAGVFGPNGTQPVERRFSTVLPKVAAVYQVFDEWFLGASYTQGYRPGGGGYNPVSQRRFEFDSERTYNYEVSLKGEWRALNLGVSLSIFHTDWKGMQVLVGSLADSIVANAGQARIDGGELTFRYRPLHSLHIIGGLGVTQGRFVDFKSSEGDFGGNPLPRAPEYSATLALAWQVTPSVLIRPEVSYTGKTSSQADNGPTHQLPGYTLFNLALRWKLGPLTLFLAGQNLTDAFYRTDAITPQLAGKDISALGSGRRISGGLDFQF